MTKAKAPKAKATWDGNLRYKVRRKWLAGRSAACIAEELGVGLRQVKTLCAELARAKGMGGAAGGGGYRHVRLRRAYSAGVLLRELQPAGPRRPNRRVPATLAVVNGAVRRRPEWSGTTYRTTQHDVVHAGGRRILRSTAILCGRLQRNGRRVSAAVALRGAMGGVVARLAVGRQGTKVCKRA
jgi:hypothetical protein